MGPIGSNVIEVKGQIYVVFFLFVPPRSLGRSSPNLEGRWGAAPDISLRGSFFERSRSSRSKVKFVFFLFSSVYVLFEIVCVCVCVCVRVRVRVCVCVFYLSSSPQSSYCYVETGKIY